MPFVSQSNQISEWLRHMWSGGLGWMGRLAVDTSLSEPERSGNGMSTCAFAQQLSSVEQALKIVAKQAVWRIESSPQQSLELSITNCNPLVLWPFIIYVTHEAHSLT